MSEAADQILDAEASLALADSYFVDEDFLEAIDLYAVSISTASTASTLFRAHSHKAAALLALGRNTEAKEDLTVALDKYTLGLRTGETEAAYYRLGLVCCSLSQHDEALTALQQAQKLATLNQRDASKYASCIEQYEGKLKPKGKAEPFVVQQEEEDEKPIVEEVEQAAKPNVIPKPVPKAKAKAQSRPNQPTMPKYQYYQSDKFMTIILVEASVQAENLSVDFSPRKLVVKLNKEGVDFTVICGRLYDTIDVERCRIVYKEEKVLIKLRKVDPHEWHELFSKSSDDPEEESDSKLESLTSTEAPSAKEGKARPYASHRDWDAIERNLKKEEATEKPEGDEAMNKLFRQIYKNADDDTRRAMIKSYQTSGGTVLSTNWNEVKTKDYEGEDRVVPEGQEWKQY